MGSARVWDEARRRRSGAPEPEAEAAPPPPGALAPDEFRALIHGIVRVTIDTRLTDCLPERRVELSRELERRLLAIFGLSAPGVLHEATPDAPPETPADSPLDAVSSAVRAPGAPAAEPRARTVDAGKTPSEFMPVTPQLAPAARTLALVLEDRLARLGGPLAQRLDLRQRLIELALENPAPAPQSGVHEASTDELRSLEVLQRRLAKLEQSLQDARAALAYVSGLEHVDTGLASIYRQVQGLAGEDPRREQKRGVLDSIYRANLALQKPGA